MKRSILLYLLLISIPLYAGYHNETRKLNLSASGIDKFKIESGSGFLEVFGKDGLDEIQVKAEIEMEGVDKDDVKEILDRYLELRLEKRGSKAFLVSLFKGNQGFFRRVRNVHIDLTVYIPSKLDVSIDKGSGSLEVENIEGKVDIEDGSGSVEIRKIAGELEIDDGSGELDIADVRGNIEIIDGSGSIHVENLTGDIIIDDGSGSIRIERVDGNVEVSDGSGSITIDDVTEDVTIKDAGSGGVSIRDVDGTVRRYDD